MVFHCTVRDIFSAACGLGVRTEVMKCTHEETRNYPLERPAPSTDEFIQRRQIITCKISSAWRFLSRSSAVRFVGAETHITPGHAGSKSICFLCCCCGQSAVGSAICAGTFCSRSEHANTIKVNTGNHAGLPSSSPLPCHGLPIRLKLAVCLSGG